MNNLNSVLIEGNLTKDPVLKTVPSGVQVCAFSIATNRYYKVHNEQQHEVSYFDVETWAKTAENCSLYLKKGSGARIVGRLKQDSWVGDDGQKRNRIKIIAEHVEFKPSFGEKKKQNDGATEKSGQEVKEAVA